MPRMKYYFAYAQYRELVKEDRSVYAYIMAAMMKADDYNLGQLRAAFPEVWEDLRARYHARDGVLPGEPERS